MCASTDDLVPPFLHFSDDVESFQSIEHMRQYVEPWDVHDDRAFDARGQRIVLRSSGVTRTRWTVGGGKTTFDEAASGDLESDEFVALLRHHARGLGVDRLELDRDIGAASVEDLVAAVARWTGTR